MVPQMAYPDLERLADAARFGYRLPCHLCGSGAPDHDCHACLGLGWIRPCLGCLRTGAIVVRLCMICDGALYTAADRPQPGDDEPRRGF